MLELGIKFLLSYLIGSIIGSMIMGRLRGGVDIRDLGSGNAGGTNALRTQGLWFALGVIVIDVGKGMLGAAVVPGLDIPGVAEDPQVSRTWLMLACAAAAVIGHVWPVWYGFRGGKGAATLIGTLLALQASLVLPVFLVWAWVLALSGYVGLATMCAGLAAPVYIAMLQLPADMPLFVYTACMAVYLVYSHRSNIARMRAGTEPKNTRVMVFSRNRRQANDGSG